MAESLPFTPGLAGQRLELTLAGSQCVFVSYWNDVEKSHYLDVFEIDDTPIIRGLKVVLGVNFVRRSTHPLFVGRALFAVDESNTGVEAGIDDLGGRVTILYLTELDLLLATQPPMVVPER